MVPLQAGGGQGSAQHAPVGYGAFIKTHALKITVVLVLLVVLTIFGVRATLVARSKKKQAINDAKKEEDVQWENYFEDSGTAAAVINPLLQNAGGNERGFNANRTQLQTPFQNQSPQVQAQVQVQAQAIQNQQQVLHAQQQAIQNQQAMEALKSQQQQQQAIQNQPLQTKQQHQAQQQALARLYQQPAPPAVLNGTAPSVQHNRQHQPAMPHADAVHVQNGGGGTMLPQSTRVEREQTDFSMPVSDVPITVPKASEPVTK